MARGTWKVKPKANAALQKAFKKTGNAASAHKIANKQIKANKGKEKQPKTDAQKKQDKKNQLEALSGILGAASDLTKGGDAHSGSSYNTDYGKGNIPTGYTAEDFWHPETTEDAAGKR